MSTFIIDLAIEKKIMKRKVLTIVFSIGLSLNTIGQEWDSFEVPADAGANMKWELQSDPSDDFNYTFSETDQKTNFGDGKWYNFYHNNWDGPGTTYWQYDHVSTDGNDLVLRSTRNPSTSKMGVPGINAGCITSNHRVKYPVFVESRISVADITLASDVWLLSPDDTQEIDIIECYGGDENGNEFFSKFIHLSHHSFIRNPFTDYQPRDLNSWYEQDGVSSWGEYCWNDGNRKYVRVGVYWVSPTHFEYYIDGQLVRVLYDKAFATKKGNTWYYTYPTMTDGELDFENGWQKATQHATSADYSFSNLKAASEASSVSVIDPFDYQNGAGMNKEMDIIINVESQDWHVEAGRTPTDVELNDPARNLMKVDWIRVYKPVESGEVLDAKPEKHGSIQLFPNPAKDSIYIQGLSGGAYKLQLYSLSGKSLIDRNIVFASKYQLKTDFLTNGSYLLKVIGEKREYNQMVNINH